MKTSIIIIGNEILNGRTRDANGHFLANWLKDQGFTNQQMIVVPDDPTAVENALKMSWKNSDLIITTGGLGPTLDDVTKDILSKYFKAELEESEQAKNFTIDHYRRINREWNPELNHYNIIPKGFNAVFNPAGLAPGLLYYSNNKLLLCAPGVPRELQAMAKKSWPEMINQFFPKNDAKKVESIVLRTKGINEEKMFSQVPELWSEMKKYGSPSSLPQVMGIDLVITIDQKNREKKEDYLKRFQKFINQSSLKSYVWQWGDESLPSFVLQKAREKGLTLGLAESCTGGLLGKQITDIPGCSDVFIGSVVSYHNNAKQSVLGVTQEMLEQYGAVSSETAQAMAKGVFKILHCDLGFSITGIAGPGGGTEEKPVGTVHMAVATKNGTIEKPFKFQFYGDRSLVRSRFAHQAMFLILDAINEYDH